MKPLGVVIGWDMQPHVLYQWPSGNTGYLPDNIDKWPHWDKQRGWPLNPDGSDMDIVDECVEEPENPLRERLESVAFIIVCVIGVLAVFSPFWIMYHL